MKKILLSMLSIAAVGVVAFGATTAFFSDVEESTGNTFTAGAIDLKIDNESYVTDNDGNLVFSDNTSWGLSDSLGGLFDGKFFFNFHDLKPGDIGEDTISIHVDDNDAWACVTIEMTENSDRTCTEPELDGDVDPSCVAYDEGDSDTHFNGELAGELQIAVWADDGDNVFEVGERLLQLGGVDDPIVTIQELAGLSEGGGPPGVLTLADSLYSVFTDDNASEPLEGGGEYYLAKAWCFGELSENPVDDSRDEGPLGADKEPGGSDVNEDRGTGFNCSGSGVDNAAQTDRVMGDLQFYAVQSRNNDLFVCEELAPPPRPG